MKNFMLDIQLEGLDLYIRLISFKIIRFIHQLNEYAYAQI